MNKTKEYIELDATSVKEINDYITFLMGVMSGSKVSVFTAVNSMINITIHLVNEHQLSSKEEFLRKAEMLWNEYENRKKELDICKDDCKDIVNASTSTPE